MIEIKTISKMMMMMMMVVVVGGGGRGDIDVDGGVGDGGWQE